MFDGVADKFLTKYRNPFPGFRFTYHFFVRLCERLGGDVDVVLGTIRHVDANICELIFDCCQSPDGEVRIVVGDAVVCLLLVHGRRYPALKATTCYRVKSSRVECSDGVTPHRG